MSRALLALVLLGCAGCSATEVAVEGLRFPVRRGGGVLAVTIEDLRPGAMENPGHLGVRRITMGIPREVCVSEGQALSAALTKALSASLTKAGYRIDPAGRALTLRVRVLEADGYFGELGLDYDLELVLAGSKTEPLTVRRKGQRVGQYKSEDGYRVALSEGVVAIVTDLLSARALVGAGAPPASQPTACAGCKKPLQLDWVACPHCGRRR